MRIMRPLLGLFIAVSLAAAALVYLNRNSWQDRIYVSEALSTGGNRPHSPGLLRNPKPFARRAAATPSDPALQRYYSESEGWTYYTLPSYSSGDKSATN
nr:hypothetical protein [uncultured bacterium]